MDIPQIQEEKVTLPSWQGTKFTLKMVPHSWGSWLSHSERFTPPSHPQSIVGDHRSWGLWICFHDEWYSASQSGSAPMSQISEDLSRCCQFHPRCHLRCWPWRRGHSGALTALPRTKRSRPTWGVQAHRLTALLCAIHHPKASWRHQRCHHFLLGLWLAL